MSVHFDDDNLRLSDDYPDQRRWANQPTLIHNPMHFAPAGASAGSSNPHAGSSGSMSYPVASSVHASPAESSQAAAVRRRSSKACDNCRKAKCKCEPGEQQGDGCRNCELLGLVCTFLGPSRKRGPPKGYIDAIESRLHQLEAILGAILLSAPTDVRARTIVEDLRNVDDMTRAVIDRVSTGPFGPAARRTGDDAGSGVAGGDSKSSGRRQVPLGSKISVTMPDDANIIDPYKWQDMLENAILRSSHSLRPPDFSIGSALANSASSSSLHRMYHGDTRTIKREPSISTSLNSHSNWVPASSEASTSNTRRRVDLGSLPGPPGEYDSWSSSASSPASATVTHNKALPPPLNSRDVPLSTSYDDGSSSDESEYARELAQGVGSLSIDDSNDVRYHGKTSGLHLLMNRPKGKDSSQSPGSSSAATEQGLAGLSQITNNAGNNNADAEDADPSSPSTTKVNTRERGGLWHFPPPGLWPPVDPSASDRRSNSTSSTPVLDSAATSSSDPTLSSSTIRNPSSSSQLHRLMTAASDLTGGGDASMSMSLAVQDDDKFTENFITTPPIPSLNTPYLEQIVPVQGMPALEEQDRLIQLYFAHVHPMLPILHPDEFFEGWEITRNSAAGGASAGEGDQAASTEGSGKPGQGKSGRPEKLSQALLFAMFAVASRYVDEDLSDLPKGSMWTAGLHYLSLCKNIIYIGKIPSRISTVQVMLLCTLFDVGMGAMASAWHCSGVAIRSALDVGLNRPVDEWRAPDGSTYFDARGIETCRRTWYGCLLMENYVATYIGRPLAVSQYDYDTPFPADTTKDELIWHIPPSDHGPVFGSSPSGGPPRPSYVPVASRIMATYTERAKLNCIHRCVVRDLYSVKPLGDKRQLAAAIEARLDKWYLDLPESLRWDCSSKHCPAPHVVVLHMSYWCSVLLVHRPLIRSKHSRAHSDSGAGSPALQATQKAYGQCEGAANRLVMMANAYAENFAMNRCPVFFTYYIFTASIMHVTILLDNPNDVQANGYLLQAMKILDSMSIVWPSAGRAYELLVAARENVEDSRRRQSPGAPALPAHLTEGASSIPRQTTKRPAEDGPEQLQHRSQAAHRRELSGLAVGRYASAGPSHGYMSESGGTQLHHRMSAPDMHAVYGGGASSSSSASGHHPRLGSLDVDSRRFDSVSRLPHSSSTPTSSSWDGPLAPSQMPPSSSYPSSYAGYNVPRMPQVSPGTFPDASYSAPYGDHVAAHQIPTSAAAAAAGYSMNPEPSPRYDQQQQQQQPRAQDHFQFQPQAALPPQHSQSFWNDYSNGADPFGDPSKLSSSLYSVPLLADAVPPQQQQQQQHQQRPPSQQQYRQNQQQMPILPQQQTPLAYPPTDRQGAPPNYPPRFEYGNMEQ